MGRNLTGQTIASTYEGLVQISGSILTDGTGSNIDYLQVTASYAANVTTPTLQSVTDAGSTTTNLISSSAGIVLHEPSIGNPSAYIQIGGVEDLTSTYMATERNGVTQFRLVSTDSINGFILNTSGSQIAKIDFSACPGEIEATGDITLDPQGGKVVVLTSVSASAGYTGSLHGNADTATTASFALTASYLDGGVALSAVLNEGNVATNDIILTGSYLRHSASFSGNVIDNLTTPTASEAINHIVYLSQAEYNAIPTPDTNTLYVISGSSVIAANTLQEVLDAGNTATQSIYLSGSIATTGSVIIDTQDDTANALYIKGGRVVIDSGGFSDSVWVNIGNNNTFTSTDKSPVMSLGAGISNQSAAHGVAFGENHTINFSGYNTFIGGGNGNTISANKAAIIGGTSNTNNHLNAVILGGTGLQTTADEQTVVSTLLISGSGGGVTFPDGTTQTTAGGGGAAFPYTGSAQITGSLEVTGSQSGLLADNEGISIFASASANTTNGNILIGAQIPTQNNYNTNIGKGNIVIGSGDWLADASGVLNGAGDFNVVLGGYSGGVNTGLYNTTIAGGNNFIGVSGSGIANTNTRFNAIIAGENNNIDDRANYNGIFAGRNNKMAAIGTNSNQYSVLVGGLGNHISSSDWSAIVGGNSHQMEFANYSGILAGNNHTFTYGSNTSAYSALVGGANNTMAHVRSAVIGGSFLTSSKDDEVTVPNLTISGSVTAGVYAITPASSTGSMDCSVGNFFTMTLDNGTDVRLEASNLQIGQTINLKLTNNATAAGTISFDTGVFKFEGGTPFTATAATNAVDVMTFISFDGSTLQATGLKNFS